MKETTRSTLFSLSNFFLMCGATMLIAGVIVPHWATTYFPEHDEELQFGIWICDDQRMGLGDADTTTCDDTVLGRLISIALGAFIVLDVVMMAFTCCSCSDCGNMCVWVARIVFHVLIMVAAILIPLITHFTMDVIDYRYAFYIFAAGFGIMLACFLIDCFIVCIPRSFDDIEFTPTETFQTFAIIDPHMDVLAPQPQLQLQPQARGGRQQFSRPPSVQNIYYQPAVESLDSARRPLPPLPPQEVGQIPSAPPESAPGTWRGGGGIGIDHPPPYVPPRDTSIHLSDFYMESFCEKCGVTSHGLGHCNVCMTPFARIRETDA